MSYPVTVLEGGKIQIGGFGYSLKKPKNRSEFFYYIDKIEGVGNVLKSPSANVEGL